METAAFYESRAHSWTPNDKEHKLIQLLESQQQRGKSKAGLNGVLPQRARTGPINPSPISSPTPSLSHSINLLGPGKVRQMFEERRNNSKGIDKSYPLEPLVGRAARSGGSSPISTKALSPTGTSGISNIGSSRKTPSPAPLKAMPITTNGHAIKGAPHKKSSAPMSTSKTSIFDRDVSGGGRLPRPSSLDSIRLASEEDDEAGFIPRTTKYVDYAEQFESTVQQKEAELRDKLKGLKSLQDAGVPPEVAAAVLGPAHLPPSLKPQPKGKPRAGGGPVAPTAKTPGPPSIPANKSPPPGTEPCSICGRCFAIDRLAKHEQICQKTKLRKLNVFDPAQAIRADLGIDPPSGSVPPAPGRAIPKAPNNTKKNKQLVGGAGGSKPGGSKGNWKAKHEDFIRTIRAAKEYNAHVAAGGDPNDLPPPPDSDYSDYIDCPHCGRKFAEGAANRHIPMCAGIKSNK